MDNSSINSLPDRAMEEEIAGRNACDIFGFTTARGSMSLLDTGRRMKCTLAAIIKTMMEMLAG